MKWEGIILDWAGTTVDFGSMSPVKVFTAIFEEAGVPVTEDEVRRPMGMLKRDHIAAMLAMPRIRAAWEETYGRTPGEADRDRLYGRFEPLLLEVLRAGTDVKPHVPETAAELRRRGYRLGSTTGFNDAMMALVIPSAKAGGYEADYWVSADGADGHGRPWPYMIFRNMMHFGWSDVRRVLKVGDTVEDIREGQHAGCATAGIVVGSSVMGLTKAEYDALSDEEKEAACRRTEQVYREAGADYILRDIRGLLDLAE